MLINLSAEELATIQLALTKQRDHVEDLIDTIRPYVHDNDLAEFRNRIAAIDAALAALARPQGQRGAWVPVEDGFYAHSSVSVQENGETIAIFVDDDYGYIEESLPADIRLCRLSQPAAGMGEGVQPNLVVNEYQLGDSKRTGGVVLRRMEQRSGPDKWAIYDGDRVVLSKEYEDGDPWEFEPLPSSRDDEYLQRCRYDSIDEALQHWQAWLQR